MVLMSLYATADVETKEAFMTVLNMVEQVQNAGAEGDGVSEKKKRKTMMELKVCDVSKSIMTSLVQHCDSVGAGLFMFSLLFIWSDSSSCIQGN